MSIDIEIPTHEEEETMAHNAEELAEAIIGRRIVSAEKGSVPLPNRWSDKPYDAHGFVITLDNGQKVLLQDTDDCCAFTELETFLLHPDKVDHIITGVGTEDGFQKWHIYADMGDVLELTVGWSDGNFPYYGYGFEIHVTPLESV